MGRAEARDGDGFADLSDDHDPLPSRSGDGVTRIVVAIRHSSLSTSTVTPGPGHPLDHLQRLLASANSTREESWAACDAQEHRGKGDASLSRRYAVVLWLEILVAGALSMGHHTLSMSPDMISVLHRLRRSGRPAQYASVNILDGVLMGIRLLCLSFGGWVARWILWRR